MVACKPPPSGRLEEVEVQKLPEIFRGQDNPKHLSAAHSTLYQCKIRLFIVRQVLYGRRALLQLAELCSADATAACQFIPLYPDTV